MHKLIIQYNDQISMLNLRNGKTYTISNDKEADITFKLLEEPIHLEQNEQGVWQNHTSIFKEFKYQTNNGEVIFNIYFKTILLHMRILHLKKS